MNDLETNINNIALTVANQGYLELNENYVVKKISNDYYLIIERCYSGELINEFSFNELKRELHRMKKHGELLDVTCSKPDKVNKTCKIVDRFNENIGFMQSDHDYLEYLKNFSKYELKKLYEYNKISSSDLELLNINIGFKEWNIKA